MGSRSFAIGGGIFSVLILLAPQAAHAQQYQPASSSQEASQDKRRKSPAVRSAPMRKPTRTQSERVDRFMQENGDQIRAARVAGKSC